LSYPIPTVINGQLLNKEKRRSTTSRKVLQDVSKMKSVNVCRKGTKKSDMDTVLCIRNLCKKQGERKIVILGDSQTRSLTGRLRDILTNKFEIKVYTKLSSNIVAIVSNTYQNIENLTNKDVLIYMGGTTDVHTNNSNNNLRYMSQFVNKHTQTNIIMLTVPHSYDRSYTSNINNEFKKFNRKFRKYMILNTRVTIIDVDQKRECFIKEGLHLNGLGKEVICKQIATIIDKLFQTERVLPICIYWETNQTIRIAFHSTNTL
jgi:hypothetical protein